MQPAPPLNIITTYFGDVDRITGHSSLSFNYRFMVPANALSSLTETEEMKAFYLCSFADPFFPGSRITSENLKRFCRN